MEHEFVFSSHASLAAFTLSTAWSSQSNTKLWKVMLLLHVIKHQNDDAFSLDRSVQDSAIENKVFRIVSASVHYTAVLHADNDGV